MIEWLANHPQSAPFLTTKERVWTYGETLVEVRSRVRDVPQVIKPRSDAESVFEVLAGIAGAGVMVAPREVGDESASLTPPSPWLRPDGPPAGTLGLVPPVLPIGTRLVMFTSGTTGPPKGARFTMPNLEAASRASVAHLGHGADDTWLLTLPLHHVGGLAILVRSAYAGGSVLLVDGFDPTEVARILKHDVTMASLVATMLTRLLDEDGGPYDGRLRAVLIGGGRIPEGLLERANSAGIPALASYGMTETFGQVATLRPGSVPARRAHPLPGVGVRIEPDGRIAVSGDQVSPGYVGEPDREGRWLLTNDFGELDQEGALIVHGRADDVVVTGGINVDPAKVEAVVTRHPGVEEAIVMGVADDEWGEALVCLYSGEAEPEELTAWVRGEIAAHMVPKSTVRVDVIPRTALGKPDRSQARVIYLSSTRLPPDQAS